MKTLMISAMGSGAGKTVLSCALLMALKKRGLRLNAFKCGPDYIDPMFHTRVLGIPSRNLDLFLQGEGGVLKTLSRAEADFALIEGAMGYYDGLGNTHAASAYALARLTGMPVVLAVSPGGSGLTLAAQIRGLMHFRPESGIVGLILTNCPERRASSLAPVLERETGLPVLGFLPPMEEARFESRHLGLMTAGEIRNLARRLEALGDAAERSIDLERLLSLSSALRAFPSWGGCPGLQTGADEAGDDPLAPRHTEAAEEHLIRHGACGRRAATASPQGEANFAAAIMSPPRCRIAVARDAAFCFLYADNLDALRRAGAELRFFSPLRDAALPAADGLYLPGGYPELHARELSENISMRESIEGAIRGGMPTVAACGGFLYLGKSLEDETGTAWPMCGVLPGEGYKTARLQRFGYLTLSAPGDSLLFRVGERVPAHEFHYWDTTENGAALLAEKTDGRAWLCGFASKRLYAAFPHLHFGGDTPLAERFVKACEEWKASIKSSDR